DGRRPPRLRRRRAGDPRARSRGARARAHAADPGDRRRAPLRAPGADRSHRGARPRPRRRGDRGRRPGDRRRVGRPPGRRLGRRRLPVVLSDQEPRRLRRRRHAVDRPRRPGRRRAAPAPSRRRGTLPPRGARLLQPPRRGAGRDAAGEAAPAGGVDRGAPRAGRPLSQGAGRAAARAAGREPAGAPHLSSIHRASPAPRRAGRAARRARRRHHGALSARRARAAAVRGECRARLAAGLAGRARGAVAAVLPRADRRRGGGRRRRRPRGPGAPHAVNQTAQALRARLAGTPTIGIIGLGYVGLPLAVAFAESGASVIGVDVDPERVAAIRAGRSFVEDVSTASLARLVAAGRLGAADKVAALEDADAIVICVPTPLGKSKEPDISFIVSAADAVAAIIRPGQLVVLESTTYPGTTQEVLRPRFEARGIAAGEDFFLAFSPERIDPGNARYTLRDIPKVVGGLTPLA